MVTKRISVCFLGFALAGLGVDGFAEETEVPAAPTFNRDIVPILQANCQSCHRPGQIAPMSFLTYQSVRPWAKAMKAAVNTKKMPPWNADPRYGHFSNDRSLKQRDIETIARWADQGSPEGDPNDKPKPIEWPSEGWQIKPDLIVDGPAFAVPAKPKNNVIEWTNIVMPGKFEKDTWITSIEVRPSEPTVTHHICLQFLPHRADVKYGVPEWVDKARDDSGSEVPADGKRLGNFFTENLRGGGPLEVCYLPGIQAADYRPFGAGKLIPAGTDIIWQVHYTPNGKETVDHPQVGFTVAKEAPGRRYVSLSAAAPSDQKRFAIPPGDSDWMAPSGEVTFTENVELAWLSPHMHLRGKSFKFTLLYPDGRQEIMLDVPHYDFNWQLGYDVAEPIKIPKGTKLITEAHYDNSPNNKFNPDPTRTVYNGNMTWEEMDTGFFGVIVDKKVEPKKILKGGIALGGGA
jgi:hypothetical protein